jgi:HD-GYP domain-containing protein (c-di-GMP phosphodiesterase class II)
MASCGEPERDRERTYERRKVFYFVFLTMRREDSGRHIDTDIVLVLVGCAELRDRGLAGWAEIASTWQDLG